MCYINKIFVIKIMFRANFSGIHDFVKKSFENKLWLHMVEHNKTFVYVVNNLSPKCTKRQLHEGLADSKNNKCKWDECCDNFFFFKKRY